MRERVSRPGREIRRVSVVTVFLTDGRRIALFERSSRVGTYQGRWAGVSGYLERLPLQQAFLEIQEETGLTRESIELVGIGIPIEVDDLESNRRWLVYPFLFGVRDPSAIGIDWESRRMGWFFPEELAALHTVPGLDRGLAAVWPPFGDTSFWNAMASVALNTSSGATSLAVHGLRAVRGLLERVGDVESTKLRAARALAACRPSMGVFPHLAAEILLAELPIAELEHRLVESQSVSARFAASPLKGCTRVLTTSYSGSVKDALILRSQHEGHFEAIVTESRPGLEGLTLARELAAEGISVTVITDAQAGLWASDVDAVLVGCDAVLTDDRVQNKAGTYTVALAAREAGVPCYAVAQTFKVVPPGFPHALEEQDPDTVGQMECVRFRNVAFDATPLGLFEAVFTEEGTLTRERLGKIRKRLASSGLID